MTASTGERLELDFYIEELEAAIEVQGDQHYRYVPLFHQSYSGFEERVRLDQEKLEICRDLGIDLLYISSESEIDELLSNLYSKIKDEENFGIDVSPIKDRGTIKKQIALLIKQYIQIRLDNGGVENSTSAGIRQSLQGIRKFHLSDKQKSTLLKAKRKSHRKKKPSTKQPQIQVYTHPIRRCPACGEYKSEANFDTLDISRSHMCRSCRRRDRVENGLPVNCIGS